MSTKTRTEDQVRFIELNKQFMDEVEKGATWTELSWLVEEMKDLAKNFEHLEPAKIVALGEQKGNTPTERSR